MKEGTRIYAVRHGETEWNAAGKQQGHLDSPLTHRGIRQAELAAEGLRPKGIDVLYSSDLGRALETAEIIADALALRIHMDQRLRERHLGAMQGLTLKEFAEGLPGEAAEFSKRNPDYALPGGESAAEQFKRCVNCAEELAARESGQTVLIVAHGGVLKSFFHRAICIPLSEPRRFSLLNASINAFSITDGRWRLDSWGEIGHLRDVEALDDDLSR